MRIGLITTRTGEIPKDDLDFDHYQAAAARAGAEIEMIPWGSEPDRWTHVDVLAFRTPWDYPDHDLEFRAWLDLWRDVRRLHNPVGLVEWNLDKRYLGQLRSDGVPTVPSWYPEDLAAATSLLAGGALAADTQVVIKPTVSAGSRHTGRFDRRDPNAVDLVASIFKLGKQPMVQPAIESVARVGEVGLLFFDGRFSHAIRKGPILAEGGGFLNGGSYAEVTSPHVPSGPELEVAGSTIAAVERIARQRGWMAEREHLAYARVDLVDDDGCPLLLEAELFEPSLFFNVHPGAADTYIAALIGRADSAPR